MTKKTKKKTAEELAREAEQDYQRDYYAANREKRTEKNKWLWENDPKYRKQEIGRARQRRAISRAEKADERFDAMLKRKRAEVPGHQRVALRMEVRVAGKRPKKVWAYAAGDLGNDVGRSTRVIREWLSEGVLPGATLFSAGDAFFSQSYCTAVYAACRKLYFLDGRGSKRVLKRLVLEELSRRKVSYVPLGGSEESRVIATASVST